MGRKLNLLIFILAALACFSAAADHYIGENPARSAAAMAKTVLAYSAFRKLICRSYVRRR